MKKILLQAVLFTICTSSYAQPYIDSFDINNLGVYNKNSIPTNLIGYGNTLYFAATDSVHGIELWAMFGNGSAPTRLTDIKPGTQNTLYNATKSIAVSNETVYFASSDTINGSELWFFNKGGGYGMVADIHEGKHGSNPSNLIPHNNKLYFSAYTKANGYELWMHEPATNKTERISDINPDSLSSYINNLTVFNSKLYFTASNPTTGMELHVYNPADGTVGLVHDILVGNGGSTPTNLTVAGNKLYFFARETSTGYEIYEYDGNNAPVRVTDIEPGTGTGLNIGTNMISLNGILYFSARDNSTSPMGLYKYDPTTQQASMVNAINPSSSAQLSNLTVYNNALYFAANDGTTGQELWKYDGTNAPVRLTDIINGAGSSTITAIEATGLGLFFSARGASIGQELFRYSEHKVGVQNMAFNADISLFPNPTKDIAHLQIRLKESKTLNVVVTDINGRTVYKTENVLYSASQHTVDIPMHNLPAGSYIYRVNDNTNTLMVSGKIAKL